MYRVTLLINGRWNWARSHNIVLHFNPKMGQDMLLV